MKHIRDQIIESISKINDRKSTKIKFPNKNMTSIPFSEQNYHLIELALPNEIGKKVAFIDGGNTIQGFLSVGLIDEITVTVIPVILGDGIPLFGSLNKDVNLTHVRTTAYDFGFVQTTYSIEPQA